MIYRTRGKHANHYSTDEVPVSEVSLLIYVLTIFLSEITGKMHKLLIKNLNKDNIFG
jgi:hypothetical protein